MSMVSVADSLCRFPSSFSADWEKQPEEELLFERLRSPSFTDSATGDEEDRISVSHSSSTGDVGSVHSSRRSRLGSDRFVLAADLSSSESDAFVCSTPGASDAEGRQEHLLHLFSRTGTYVKATSMCHFLVVVDVNNNIVGRT